MKQLFLCALVLGVGLMGLANDKDTTKEKKIDEKELMELNAMMFQLDSVEKTLDYKQGNIKLENGMASLNVPTGFKFINAQQSRYIIEDLWHNLPDPSVVGMIVPDSFHINSFEAHWAFVVSYEGLGYVKDHDADEINYDDLLKEMKKEQEKANEERKKLGYDELHLVGWAAKPFYDKEHKVLHWAKEINVSGSTENTLNYDVRVLGRKGVLSMNALASMNDLEEVKKQIPAILKMSNFDAGYTYSDFKPDVDEVAAWTIGGLVAGKILAKAGFFVILLKFWKLIILAIAGAGGAIWRFITGRRKKDDYTPENLSQENNA